MHLLAWAFLLVVRACGTWLGLPWVVELETSPGAAGPQEDTIIF